MIGVGCWVFGTYFPLLADERFFQFQVEITDWIMGWIFGPNRSSLTEFYHHVYIYPAIALVGTFGFNLGLLLKKHSVARTLYSTGEITFFGEKFPETIRSERDKGRVPKCSGIKTCEYLLFRNIVDRMINVFKHDFWRMWWRDWVVGKCPGCLWVCGILWLPFSFFLVMVHVLPICSVWENYLGELLCCCVKGKDKKGKKLGYFKRIYYMFYFLIQIVGIVMIYVMAWDFLFCYVQLVVFVSIDIIRNAAEHLPKIVLAFAVLGYIKGAFWNFSDKYRELKMGSIQGLRDLHWEVREEYYHYNKAIKLVFLTPPYEVVWDFSDYGEISIPRRFFYEVVNIYRPYKFFVIRMLMKLFITIAIITLLVLLIIDFQILGQFNSSGQLLLTLFTVSLPLLIGAVRSPWQRELSIKRRHLNIRAWAERISRIVATEKYPVESEEEREARMSKDTAYLGSDLALSEDIVLSNDSMNASGL